MIFDLVRDFADVLAAMPAGHPRQRILKLLDEAIRRDVHFIDRHRQDYPQALFQCLWNYGWWYDCPDIERYYETTHGHWRQQGEKLHKVLETWRAIKESSVPSFLWMRSLRPPFLPLGQRLKFILVGQKGINCLAFSPDGAILASGADDHTVVLWSMATGQQLAMIAGCEASIQQLGFSHDGRWLAIKAKNNVRICLVETGEVREVHCIADNALNNTVCFPDGQPVLPPHSPYDFRVGDSQEMNGLGQPTDYRLFVTRHDSKTSVATLDGSVGPLYEPCSSSDGHYIAAISLRDYAHEILVWDLGIVTNGDAPQLQGEDMILACLASSPDGRRLLTASMNGSVCVWNASNGTLVANIGTDVHMERTLAYYTSDGKEIYSNSRDGSRRAWDAESLIPTGYPSPANQFPYRHKTCEPPRFVSSRNPPDASIVEAATGLAVVWFSPCVWFVPIPPERESRVWSATDGSHLRILTIEGDLTRET